MSAVVWCDPPTRVPVWVQRLSPCMERPGVWALVKDDWTRIDRAQQAVRDLRRAVRGQGNIAVPAGRWEFTSGQVDANRARFGVWARWLGE